MGQVIAFPTADERSWRLIESGLREGLRDGKAPVDAIDWICRDLKPRYFACQDGLSFSLEIPAGCEKPVSFAVEQMTSFLHKATDRMMLEMAKLEAELYAAKAARPGGG